MILSFFVWMLWLLVRNHLMGLVITVFSMDMSSLSRIPSSSHHTGKETQPLRNSPTPHGCVNSSWIHHLCGLEKGLTPSPASKGSCKPQFVIFLFTQARAKSMGSNADPRKGRERVVLGLLLFLPAWLPGEALEHPRHVGSEMVFLFRHIWVNLFFFF